MAFSAYHLFFSFFFSIISIYLYHCWSIVPLYCEDNQSVSVSSECSLASPWCLINSTIIGCPQFRWPSGSPSVGVVVCDGDLLSGGPRPKPLPIYSTATRQCFSCRRRVLSRVAPVKWNPSFTLVNITPPATITTTTKSGIYECDLNAVPWDNQPHLNFVCVKLTPSLVFRATRPPRGPNPGPGCPHKRTTRIGWGSTHPRRSRIRIAPFLSNNKDMRSGSVTSKVCGASLSTR